MEALYSPATLVIAGYQRWSFEPRVSRERQRQERHRNYLLERYYEQVMDHKLFLSQHETPPDKDASSPITGLRRFLPDYFGEGPSFIPPAEHARVFAGELIKSLHKQGVVVMSGKLRLTLSQKDYLIKQLSLAGETTLIEAGRFAIKNGEEYLDMEWVEKAADKIKTDISLPRVTPMIKPFLLPSLPSPLRLSQKP